MKNNLYSLQKFIFVTLFSLASVLGWGQWTYDFGTGTGTFTSSTASTTFLPTPTSGTARVRVGTNPGSFVLANPGIALGANSELQFTSNTGSTSTSKFSIYDYTAAKVGYMKFKIAFNGGTNGVYQLSLGDGVNYSDNIALGTAQIFAGIQWNLGTSNTITYKVLNSATYGTTGITNSTTLFSQSTSNEYSVEIYMNNNNSAGSYYRAGTNYSLAVSTWDLWVNGVRQGTNLAKGGIGSNVNIDSFAFNHQASATAPGTVYIDDIEYSNTLPTGYSVTYDGNGNTTGSAPTDSSSPYAASSTVTVLGKGSLDKTGYTFNGWNSLATGLGTDYGVGSTFTINANTTLYAKWLAIVVPTVTTTAVSGIANNGASSGGNVTADGNDSVTARGVYFGTSANPTSGTSDGTGTGVFTSSLTGLSTNTQYYYRAYAINSAGTGYGAENSFYTLANVPTAPTVNNTTSSTLDVIIGSGDSNPSTTQYAIRQKSSGQYVQADGTLGASAVWQTAATWGTKTVTGLTSSTTYNFDVKARNGDNTETGFGAENNNTTLVNLSIDWGNLQWPSTATIDEGTTVNVYAQAYKSGATEAGGQAADLYAWIGYSTSNTNPNGSGWTWIPASFSSQSGNNDEFVVALGTGLTPGTYYYASRFQVGSGSYSYGGFNGGFWNGTSNVSGVLTVNSNLVNGGQVTLNPATTPEGNASVATLEFYEPGLSDTGSQNTNVTIEFAYKATTDSNPSGWSGWSSAGLTYTDFGNNDKYSFTLPNNLPLGTYYVAARAKKTGSTEWQYFGNAWNTWSNSAVLTVDHNVVDWGNIQWPPSGTITVGGAYNVYARVYEPGVTNVGSPGAGVTAWIGYNTTNNNPSTAGWIWVPASFSGDYSSNDEYMANIGTSLSVGTYYYASRFQKTGSTEYYYGGYNAGGGGAWDGTSNVSGVLTVNPNAPVVTGGTASGTVGVAFTYNISATNSPTSYALNSGTLPPGLGINVTTGQISGTPTSAGVYTFDVVASNAGGTSAPATITITIIAANHTITFNSNGGSGTMSNQTTNTSTAITLNTFTRTGYTFAGWATSAGGAVVYTDGQSYDFSADITLYAKWTPNNNTITFDANGGTGTMSNQIIATGATASLSANTFTRAGYTFAGWATTAGGAVAYADGASYTMGTGNVTLYAKWTANNYNVIFNANGGSGVMSNQSIASGSSAALSTNTFTRTGYTFSGWNTAIDGSGTSYANGATYTMGTNDITLYAQWQVLPCLTETFDGGIPVTWTTGGGTTAVNNSGSDYYLNLNENGEYAQLPTSLNYASVSFNLKGSASSNGWTLYLQYSTDGSTWNNVGGSGTIAGTSIGTSYSLQSVTLPTATSYVRLFLQRTGNSAYIGDVFGYCSTNPTITVTPTAALSLGTTICQGSSGTGNYTVKGTNLTNDIVITPPANIEISTDNSTWVTTPVTLTQTGGNVATTTIYVRSSNALGAGAFSGTITHVSTGATTINKSITGTVIASQTPTATVGASSTSVCNGSSVTLTATSSNVGGGTVAYQWYKNSSIASGATNSTFTDSVTADSSYYCVITITGGCVTTSTATSNTVTVSAIALPSAPALPTITTSCNQATASAVTSVEGTVYWETSSSGILETNSADTPRIFTTAGTYYLRVKNASGCWSPSTTVTITFPSLSITTNVTDVSATVGTNATFSVTSPDAVSYQWEQSTDGGSSWTPIPSATSSSYVVTSVTLGMSGYKYHVILTGSAPCTTTTSAVGTLTVSTYSNGDYRTTGSGTWSSSAANNTITWEVFNGTTWDVLTTPSTYPPTNTTKNVYILHNVTLNGTNTSSNIIIGNGGTLNTNTVTPTFTNVLVKTGGTFNKESNSTTINGVFEVEDGGLVTIKHTNTTSYATTIWAGTEKFHPNSTLKILTVDATVAPLIAASNTISAYTENGVTALFGNIIIDCSTGKLQLVYSGFNAQLTAKDLIFRTNASNTALSAGDITTTIGGDLNVENTYTQPINFSSAGTAINVTVKGNVLHNGTTTLRPTTNLAANSSFTVEGNLSVTGGGTFLPNGGSGALTGTSVVNLKGNLTVSSSSSLTSTATGTNTFNFTGTTGTQTIDVANTTSVAQLAFVANNGSYVKLINQDLAMGTNSSFTIKNLATLDFGFNGTTGLNLSKVGVQTGQTFNAQAGSTLKITSVDGISNGTSVYTGNVQIGADATKRIFDAGATYHYIGKANQISGNGLPTDLSSKVIVELDTNALTFQPLGSNTITSAGTLEIRKGIVLDNATGSFKDATSANANLIMSGGRLQLYKTGTMPDLSGAYNLTAGVIEFANTNASAQTIRTKSYQNIEVTGNNVGNSSGNITLLDNGTFTVKNGGIFSINANSIIGNGSGTHTVTVENGGTFRTGDVDGFSGTALTSIQPSIESIVLADGSTVEYSRADVNQTITPFNVLPATPVASDYTNANYGYYNLKISGDNTTIASAKMVAGKTVYVRNNLDVVSPAILKIPASNAITINNNITSAGDANFIVESDANLVQINPAAINTGNITSKREAVMRRLYYTYWSSSVGGQILKNFSPGTLNSRFYTYKESDDTFLSVADPTTTPFTKGLGYAIRASNAAASTDYTFVGTFKGTPNNGNISIGLDYTDDAHGYNMIGNPYPSNIDFDKLYTNNTGSIYHTAYFWTNVNPNPSSQGSSYLGDNYAIYTGAGGVDGATTTSVGSNNPTKYISVGQGFIVKAKNGSSVNYTNDIRTSTAGNFINKKADDTNRYWLKLISPVGNVNTILLAYMSDATNDIDNDYDAERLVIGSDAFYSLVDDKKLGIQARSYPLNPSDVVGLGTKHAENGSYTITLSDKEGIFAEGQSIYLHDKALGTYTDLQQGDYTYVANVEEVTDRFEITYKPGGTLDTDNGAVKKLVVYTKDQNYVIEAPEKVLEVKLIDASGKLITTLTPNKNKVEINNATLTNGVYVLQIRTATGITVKKVIK